MARLDYIKANRDHINLDDARENYEKAQFLEAGENGELSEKQQLEQELISL